MGRKSKRPVQFRLQLSVEERKALETLADRQHRCMAGAVRYLLAQEFRKEGLEVIGDDGRRETAQN